jgi:hypothetical protein
MVLNWMTRLKTMVLKVSGYGSDCIKYMGKSISDIHILISLNTVNSRHVIKSIIKLTSSDCFKKFKNVFV